MTPRGVLGRAGTREASWQQASAAAASSRRLAAIEGAWRGPGPRLTLALGGPLWSAGGHCPPPSSQHTVAP